MIKWLLIRREHIYFEAPGTGGRGAAPLRIGLVASSQTGRGTGGDEAERFGALLEPVTEWR
jgi:hypothetical protein